MDLPPFDNLLATAFHNEGIQEDPFDPVPVDQPLGDDSSLLSSSIATLLATANMRSTPVNVIPDTTFMPSPLPQEEEMSAYVESLSQISGEECPKPKKKSHHRHKKHKKSSHKYKKSASMTIPLPAKPRDAYQLFSEHVRMQLSACSVAQEEWEDIINRRWKSMDMSTRTYFSEVADREMAFFRSTLSQYRKVCRRMSKNKSKTLSLPQLNKLSLVEAQNPLVPTSLPEPAPITPPITPSTSSNDLGLVLKQHQQQSISFSELTEKLGNDSNMAFIKIFSSQP